MDSQVARELITQMEVDYDAIAEHFSATRSSQWYIVNLLMEQYVRPGQTVLDLGCGNGRVADIANKIKASYLGVDLSRKLIAHAHRLHPHNQFAVGSMLDIPARDQQFDHTILVASFHHIPSRLLRLQTLAEIKRVTKLGGYCIMINWNLHQRKFIRMRYQSYVAKLFGQNQLDWNDLFIPWRTQTKKQLANRYYHGFTQHEIHSLAREADFEVVEQYYETHGMHVHRTEGQNLVSVLRTA